MLVASRSHTGHLQEAGEEEDEIQKEGPPGSGLREVHMEALLVKKDPHTHSGDFKAPQEQGFVSEQAILPLFSQPANL